jgi:ABC-type uncharacterized transport system ATPase subunit
LTTHNFQEAAAVGDRIAVLRRGEVRSEREFRRSAGNDGPSIDEVKALYFQASADSEDDHAFETAQ